MRSAARRASSASSTVQQPRDPLRRASREVEVVSEAPLHVQLDGDVLGPARRLTVRCEEHALLVRT